MNFAEKWKLTNDEWELITCLPIHTSYTVSSTADDICSVVWMSMNSIVVRKCRILFAQGGSTILGTHYV